MDESFFNARCDCHGHALNYQASSSDFYLHIYYLYCLATDVAAPTSFSFCVWTSRQAVTVFFCHQEVRDVIGTPPPRFDTDFPLATNLSANPVFMLRLKPAVLTGNRGRRACGGREIHCIVSCSIGGWCEGSRQRKRGVHLSVLGIAKEELSFWYSRNAWLQEMQRFAPLAVGSFFRRTRYPLWLV